MTRREAARTVWPALIGLGLLAGMFMMHGITATPSPVHGAAPVMSAHGGHHQAAGSARAGHSGHAGASGHLRDSDHSDHSGLHEAGCMAGTVCLALLAGLALTLLRGRARNLLSNLLARPSRAVSYPVRPPPRPPGVYRLSVLRL